MSRAPRPRVLVVDDDVRLSEALLRALESMGYEAAGETEPAKGLERVGTWRPDAAVVDLRMPAMDGVTWAEKAMEEDPDLPVLLLTGFGTIRSAVEAVKRGVFDYLAKPFDLDEVDVALRKALRHRELKARNRALSDGLARVEAREGIVGESPALREVLAAVSAVAPTDSTVLLIGESGTGKELVSKAIHAAGPRRDRPFVTVDCAALAGALLESELFGHARGSFTGAHRDRAGYLEVASDGTVFLDEIGELDLALQKKLLRALEERTYARVGETRRRQTEARLVAATNRDLGAEVEAGRFREDLYYRLRVIEIRVPPLRERFEDLPALVAHHMALLNRRLKRSFRGASPAALEALTGPLLARQRARTRQPPRAGDDLPRRRGARSGAPARAPATPLERRDPPPVLPRLQGADPRRSHPRLPRHPAPPLRRQREPRGRARRHRPSAGPPPAPALRARPRRLPRLTSPAPLRVGQK